MRIPAEVLEVAAPLITNPAILLLLAVVWKMAVPAGSNSPLTSIFNIGASPAVAGTLPDCVYPLINTPASAKSS